MIVKIKRQKAFNTKPYWQSFQYNGPANITVSALLDAINYTDDLIDTEGAYASRVRWERSCVQGMCGGCAMVINGVPALACETVVNKNKEELVLEPLSKFPVIADLYVDRSIIHNNLNRAKVYFEGNAQSVGYHYEQQYSVAKCLKCGLCLEVCPNYRAGSEFFGAVLANESYLAVSQSQNNSPSLVKEYKEHFGNACSNSLSCQSVCPAKIETVTSIMRMNRL